MRRRPMALKIGLLLLSAAVVAGCGGGGAASSASAEADPAGEFIRGVSLTQNGGVGFDPATMRLGWTSYTYPVTNSWLKINTDGTYAPDLAEKVTVVDSRTITVDMKPGLVFSDGQTLDAQAAVASIQRTKAAKPTGLRFSELNLIDTLTVKSPTEFTITLTKPAVSQFYGLLTDAETTPVAASTINTPGSHDFDVVTAGPFKLESYEPNVKVRMVKNDRYWDAANVRLAAIEYRHVGNNAAAMNALRAGTIDFVNGNGFIGYADVQGLPSKFEGYSNMLPATQSAMLCMKPGDPLGDVRVRQALSYAVDRDQVNNLLYSGTSAPAWGMVPKGNRLYAPDLDQVYAYDPAKAKQLLAEAGYPNGLNLTAVTLPAVLARHMEILQGQWQKVGINVQIIQTNNLADDWSLANGAKAQVTSLPIVRDAPTLYFRNFTSDAYSNVCHYQVPPLDECATKMAALDVNSQEFVAQGQECQRILIKDMALVVNTVHLLDSGAYDKSRIGGVSWQVDATLIWQPDVTKLYVAKSA